MKVTEISVSADVTLESQRADPPMLRKCLVCSVDFVALPNESRLSIVMLYASPATTSVRLIQIFCYDSIAYWNLVWPWRQ